VAAAVAFLTLLTGATKCVSVCGVNAAAVATPTANGRGFGIGAYFVGLFAGAFALTALVAFLGAQFFSQVAVDPQSRILIAASLMAGVGGVESIVGRSWLPHVQWAVPSTWAMRIKPTPFLLLFGLIRGVAVFNHSPFASMHAWLAIVFLLHDAIPVPLISVTLASALAFWSGVYAVLAVVSPADSRLVFRRVAFRSLSATAGIARLDGIALAVCGAVLVATSRY